MVHGCALARRVWLSSLAALAGEIILNGGQKAFMRRAIDKANSRRVSATPPSSTSACLCTWRHVRMVSAVGAANQAITQQPVEDRTERGGFNALIQALHKEEVKVHLDLDTKIQVRPVGQLAAWLCTVAFTMPQEIKLKGLPSACFPTSESADKLAGLRAKAMKASIARPFPFMDMAEFQPSWAKVAGSEESGTTEKVLCTLALPRPHLHTVACQGKKRLNFVQWLSSYMNFALAADAAKVRGHLCLVRRLAQFQSHLSGDGISCSHGSSTYLHGVGW